jgi:hypothetical protein
MLLSMCYLSAILGGPRAFMRSSAFVVQSSSDWPYLAIGSDPNLICRRFDPKRCLKLCTDAVHAVQPAVRVAGLMYTLRWAGTCGVVVFFFLLSHYPAAIYMS